MSPQSRGRPPGRGRPKGKAGPARPLTLADRVLADARYLVEDCEDALSAELWASESLGLAWVAAKEQDEAAEHALVVGLARLAARRPSIVGSAALAALRLVADETGRGVLDEALQGLGAGRPLPAWAGRADWVPVAAHRAVDVWESERVLFVDFDGPQPHCLLVVISEVPGRWVTELEILEPGSAREFDDREDGAAPSLRPVEPRDVAETLADIADALRSTDRLWPREDDPDYVELRALAWARSRAYLPTETEPAHMPLAERGELVEAFATSGAMPDDDLTRALAELFVDFGDGGLPVPPLGWNPDSVEYFLTEWAPQMLELDEEEQAALPEALRHWVDFALTRRGLAAEWIDPVVGAVYAHAEAFQKAYAAAAERDAAELAALLLARGVDLTDEAAVEAELLRMDAEWTAD
jgi:hypothetical protein